MLTLVVADDGRNSFAELAFAEDEDDEPTTTLSQSLSSVEELSLRVGPIRLAPIRARVVQVAEGVVETESALDSLAITSDGISLGEALGGSLRIVPAEGDEVAISVVDSPRTATATRERSARLVPTFEASVEADRTLRLVLHMGLVEQTLFPQLARVRVLVEAESRVTFRPDDGQTTLEVATLSVLDSMLVAKGRAIVDDDSSVQAKGEGRVAVATLPWELPWLAIDDL
jgi:hypothetical protein